MTVLSWGNSDGVKGRCDARCHTAKKPDCACMCGGRYHGSVRLKTFARIHLQHGSEILAAAQRRVRDRGWTVINGGAFAEVVRRLRASTPQQLPLGVITS